MNEVTRIHLGRQPFTISVEAHHALKNYLAAIKKQVHDQDVIDEIELRMAELLQEHGITEEKVVLEPDVDYLKEQLGDPKDFTETDEDRSGTEDRSDKQLFRDTDNGMLAGVAAGLAAYFGIDALLVRILFVIGILTGGWGILVYIVLWLLVPPAKSGSDRLRMQGKPVTLESLKQVAERADAKGAVKRAGGTIVPVVNSFFRFVLKVTGLGFIFAGLSGLFGLIAVRVYMALHSGQLFQENLFPVGRTEHFLADLILALLGFIAVVGVVCGLAIYKRRWPLKAWITGVLFGLFFIGMAVAIALSADAVPKVRDRYLARAHTVTRSVQPFQDVTIEGKDVDYRWEYADSYSVSFHYFDNPDVNDIKTTVTNDLLTIDTSNYTRLRKCNMLCIFPAYNLLITVKGPRALPSSYPAKQIPAIPDVPVAPVPKNP